MLPSADLITGSPIDEEEEEEGVETSTPPDIEMTSPNQPSEAHDEDLDMEKSTGGEEPVFAKKTSDHGDHSSKNITSMVSLHPTDTIISQEELDQLEKVNPLDAFDFLVKSDVLFSKSGGKSSNVSTDDPSETSKENLLTEFRNKVLKANLLEAIKQDDNVMMK